MCIPEHVVRSEMTKQQDSDFREYYERGQAILKAKVKMKQIEKALVNGSSSMLRHLGRFDLGQNEQELEKKTNTEESNPDATTIEFL